MPYTPISFVDKFAKFSEQWSPKIIAQMNDYHFKLVKIQGEFVWHSHVDTDEVFVVEHKPSVNRECKIMLVELAGTTNTGDVQSTLTGKDGAWV